ncbi:branched-chain amino acid aminotransferase [Methylocystis parvus]|uniref:Probable branched-chain-amino-acid aminotransferase n=1 Tax=Methylocystis parvus TaxID=134 RepID=A0A6B8M7L4_9HYPH|nr:branched-chain amino acid aminotransferase [Methylocystis parvus]QGM98496.1 branched-chain amino acid aminotransferase [Methylocystis parvus]WBK01165.1 branched-chain amino acid aminotransferase [Methylocystis parvus OBBP]
MASPVQLRPVSQTWTFFQGEWRDGNAPILGPRTHGAWLGSMVFDGARAFEGVTPDLDLHLARVNNSAREMLLEPTLSVEEWRELVEEGLRKFPRDAQLYIRPMYWAEDGLGGGVRFEPNSTNWCLTIYEALMPAPKGGAVTLSPFRRPSAETAPVGAKASCHYANGARALIEAAKRGFDNCLMRDMLGNIAEFANSNAFMAKDGVVFTPAANGTFLNGVTRQRVIGLLRADGVQVVETSLSYDDFLRADEIFSTGNFQKVAPMSRIDDRALEAGLMYKRARSLYWDFAHSRAPLRAVG